jgi:ribosomal subunit interface protein
VGDSAEPERTAAQVELMKVRVSGKQIEIGSALQEHVRLRLEIVLTKHLDRGADTHVVFSHEGSGYRSDCTMHLDSGVVLNAEGDAHDAHHAFDAALEKLEKQIRRHKRKLRNHHDKAKLPKEADA